MKLSAATIPAVKVTKAIKVAPDGYIADHACPFCLIPLILNRCERCHLAFGPTVEHEQQPRLPAARLVKAAR